MWKLLFMARRGWKMVPNRHKRRALVAAAMVAKEHGPKAVELARRVRAARKTP
jgi:hypothetical protein